MRNEEGIPFHTHEVKPGLVVRCYHSCRTGILTWSFWLGLTLGFPLEHLLWEKAPGFRLITHWLGL